MSSCRWPLAVVLALLLGGCHGGVETEVLERELRRQEDYIYQLQDQIEQYRMALDGRRPAAAGDQQPTPARGDNGKEASDRRSPPAELPAEDQLKPPAVDLGTPEGQLAPPPVEMGTPVEPPLPKSDSPPSASPSNPLRPSLDGPEMVPAAADASRVERIVLRTTAADRPGLKAILERRTATGRVAPIQGAVSLMVLDPTPAGRQQRIARWDFSAEQVDARQLRTTTGRTLQLDLPWPDGPPAAGRYQLWGRVVVPDGRKLLTNLPVDIDRLGRARLADNQPMTTRPMPPQRGYQRPQPAAATAGRPTWKPYR